MSQGKFKAKKNSDEENANWNLTLFYSPPPAKKSKILRIKKSSFVLASISKKCKLKFDKNISLVQNISTGISSGILNSSYHALSWADGCLHGDMAEKPGHSWKRLRLKSISSHHFRKSKVWFIHMSINFFFFWMSGRKRHYRSVSKVRLCS